MDPGAHQPYALRCMAMCCNRDRFTKAQLCNLGWKFSKAASVQVSSEFYLQFKQTNKKNLMKARFNTYAKWTGLLPCLEWPVFHPELQSTVFHSSIPKCPTNSGNTRGKQVRTYCYSLCNSCCCGIGNGI